MQFSPEYKFSLLDERLKSFKNWSVHEYGITIEDLSHAGFFHCPTQNNQFRTKCAFCGGLVDSWQHGDNPSIKHKQLFPQCSFILEDDGLSSNYSTIFESTGDDLVNSCQILKKSKSSRYLSFSNFVNKFKLLHRKLSSTEMVCVTSVPSMNQIGLFKQFAHYHRDQSGQILTDKPPQFPHSQHHKKYSGPRHMNSESNRLKTFHNWPPQNYVVKPKELARAGFYYDTIKIRNGDYWDQVKCAFCRCALHSWEKGDEPMKEHRRAFPMCPFMLSMNVGNQVRLSRGAEPQIYKSVSNGGIQYCNMNGESQKFVNSKKRFASFDSDISAKRRREFASYGYYSINNNIMECYKCHFQSTIHNDRAIEDHKEKLPICPYLSQFSRNLQEEGKHYERLFLPTVAESEISDIEIRDKWAVRKAIEELGFHPDLVLFVARRIEKFCWEEAASLQFLVEMILNLENLMKQFLLPMDEPTAIKAWIRFIQAVQQGDQEEEELKERNLFHNFEENFAKWNSFCDSIGFNNKGFDYNNVTHQRNLHDCLLRNSLCQICQISPRDVLLLPCSHFLMCQRCSGVQSNCPSCLLMIETTVPISV